MNGLEKRISELVTKVGDVCRAARQVQLECDDTNPHRINGSNVTKIKKAAAKERRAIQELFEAIGLPHLSKVDLSRCQNADEDKAVA